MQVFENQTFDDFDDRDSAAIFSDIEFHRCCFDGCLFSITRKPNLRTTVRNVSLIDCTLNGGSIGTAIVEDVLVDGLRIAGLFQTFGAVFKHVTLCGRIGNFMINSDVLPDLFVNREYQHEDVDLFREVNAEYYRHVDWALDISRAEFIKEVDIRGIPSRLIRRDPETQIVVTRERVLGGGWSELDFRERLTSFSLNFMLNEGWPDMVMIAPKRHRKFPFYLHDLQLLREAGIAEPD
jgi:hypothetical protein